MTGIAKAVPVIDYGRFSTKITLLVEKPHITRNFSTKPGLLVENPALHNKLSTKPGSFVDKHILRRQNHIPEFCKYNEIID